MYLRHSAKYGKSIKIIHPGELYVSNKDEIIGTLLGSCVSVCIMDLENGIAGLNHFMLPGKITRTNIFSDKSARYGVTAINELIKTMETTGAKRKNFKAKVFGGGHVLESEVRVSSIPSDNIRLAMVMLEIDDIPVIGTDVGENFTRKLLLDVKTGKVYLKKSTRKDVFDKITEKEVEYARRSFTNG